MKNALILMHVPFEGPAAIRDWLTRAGFTLRELQCGSDTDWQALDLPDWLVIMGGPMSANDDATLPWLGHEMAFIKRAIDAGKKVLGVCLGAQMIARVLGAAVTRNPAREIGWFPVTSTVAGQHHPLGQVFADAPSVLHWHGETFDIPAGAVHLAQSECCTNQAFLYRQHVLGLQCHLEMGRKHVERLCAACADELAGGGTFVQPASAILATDAPFADNQQRLDRLLDAFLALS